MKKVALASVATTAVIGAAAVGGWFVLSDGDEATTRGICGAASYELSLEEEDGGLEATYELQSTAPGESWDVVVDQDGVTILQGERQTDADGELEVDVPVAENADEIAVSVTLDDGTPCAAAVSR
jgi:hypothetical protein